MARRFFTSESVTEGHPDKVCDCVSDAILDAILAQDKEARVACETTCTTGVVTVMGEITTTAQIDIPKIVREVVCDIGYNSADMGFDGNTCAVMTALSINGALSVSICLRGNKKDEEILQKFFTEYENNIKSF